MKLKTGFKQLFGTTVFGYLHTARMQEAKRLLTKENLYVNDVRKGLAIPTPIILRPLLKSNLMLHPDSCAGSSCVEMTANAASLKNARIRVPSSSSLQ